MKEYHEKFYDAIKECCITRVCGVFEIGPRPVKSMGFDLVIYENCIDFCIEKCEELNYEKLTEKVERKRAVILFRKEMKSMLSIMRKIHLVHCDIKPENILKSPYFKKIVLIDFGLAKFLKEKPN